MKTSFIFNIFFNLFCYQYYSNRTAFHSIYLQKHVMQIVQLFNLASQI